MTTPTLSPVRVKALASALEWALTPAQRTMVRECIQAENPGMPKPEAGEMLFWMRLNMPQAAARIDRFLNPCD